MSTLQKQTRILTEHDSDGTHNLSAATTIVPLITGDSTNLGNLTTAVANKLLIWDKIITGSAVTSVTTNGEVTLDGNTHGGYAFEFIIYNPTGGAIVPRLYFENDTTNTNYYFTDTAGGAWGNDAILGPTGGIPTTGEMRMAGIIVISPRGYLSSTGERAFAHPTHEANIWAHHKTATVTNLTRVDIVSSVASGIGINSRFRLWRRL